MDLVSFGLALIFSRGFSAIVKRSFYSEVRFCKKCGCEFVGTNKRKLCGNCRRERAGKIRNGVMGAIGTVVVVLLYM